MVDLPLAMCLLLDLRSLINEPHPVAQHAIDQPSELGRHSLGRHGSIQPPFQSAKLRSQIAVALPQDAGRHAQNHVQPVIRGQSPCPLPGRHGLGCPAKVVTRKQNGLRWAICSVPSRFADHGHRGQNIDPLDLCQVCPGGAK